MDQKLKQFATSRQWEYLEAYDKHGTDRAAGAAMGVSKNCVYQARKAVTAKAIRNGYSPEHDMIHPTADGYKISGISTLYDSQTGEAKIQWVKTQADKDRQLEIVRELIDDMVSGLPKLEPRAPVADEFHEKLLTVIPMGDPHIGLYSWTEETGEGNEFNLEIAKRDLCGAVDYLVKNGPASERCLIISVGDFFHADNFDGVTSRSGNRLDMDSRLPNMVKVGFAAIRQCIESALDFHKFVDVICAVGNHDDVLSTAMSIMLANVYESEIRVKIHDQPTRRHYYQHGKVLIGVTHGDQTKDSQLPLIMATERKKEWGEARFTHWFRGHHHSDSRVEYQGTIVEQVRTMAAADSWSVGKGYLSGRDMKSILFHSDYGEQFRTTCGLELLRDLQKCKL